MNRPVAIVALACVAACASGNTDAETTDYVVLEVTDPDRLAGGAVAIAFGTSLDSLTRVELGGLAFPVTFALSASGSHEDLVWIDALAGTGTALARGRARVRFGATDDGRVTVRLGAICGPVPVPGLRCATDDGAVGICETNRCGPLDTTWHCPSSGLCQAAVVEAATGGYFTCARLGDGSVSCWGFGGLAGLGYCDQLDHGDTPGSLGTALPRVDWGGGRATSITSGEAHSCVVLEGGAVKCWGQNSISELGIVDGFPHGGLPGTMGVNLWAVPLGAGRVASQVVAGSQHTCVLFDDGAVKCWGKNDHGQLGVNDTALRGARPGTMGDSLPAVQLGTGRSARALALGSTSTCALLDDASIKCWGFNDVGQLGLGDTVSRGDGFGGMGGNLPAVALGGPAEAVACGPFHCCALLVGGAVKCWGWNYYGQLGNGSLDSIGDEPGEMGSALAPVALGSGRSARFIAAGGDGINFAPSSHTCAILNDDTVKCWGNNLDGQLGIGDTLERGSSPNQMGDFLPAVALGGRIPATLSLGSFHTCATFTDRSMACWGYNGYGELGLGDTTRRGDDAGEMGDALSSVEVGPVGVNAPDSCVGCGDLLCDAALGEDFNTCPSDCDQCVVDVNLGSQLGNAIAAGSTNGLSNRQDECSVLTLGGPEITFSWTAPTTGRFMFDTFGSQLDTALAAHTAACAQLGCSTGDADYNQNGTIVADLAAGEVILLTIETDAGPNAADSFVLNAHSCGEDCPLVCHTPDGDLGSAVGQAVATDTTDGSTSVAVGSCDSSEFAEKFLRWTAPTSGIFVFDTIGSASIHGLVARNTACAEIGCTFDAESAALRLPLSAGTQLELAVEGAAGPPAGTFVLNITQE